MFNGTNLALGSDMEQSKEGNDQESVQSSTLSDPGYNMCVTQTQEYTTKRPGPEVKKVFPCSIQLSTKFILLINVKMPTIVGILTFISMINTTSERLKARNFFICRYSSFYEQL